MILPLLACGPDGAPTDSGRPAEPRPAAALVDMAAWQPGDAAVHADPDADERAPGTDCPTGGSYLEGSSLEINTALCTWAWFQQPALADLRRGDVVELVYWHSALVADPPAQGHLALSVGDEVLYDTLVDIPKDAAAYTESVEVGFDAAAGEVVTLHLHNHGANTWNLLRVDRQATP